MAYEVPAVQLGAASGFYTAGGTFAKAVGGAGTRWLLTHLSDRPLVAGLSTGGAALAATAILLASPGHSVPLREFPGKLRSALAELWNFARTRSGMPVAVLCVIPFGAGTESGLIGAIAPEWAVSPDQLAAFGALGAVTSITGAIVSGWFSTRIAPWKVYIIGGWATQRCLALLLRHAQRSTSSVWSSCTAR